LRRALIVLSFILACVLPRLVGAATIVIDDGYVSGPIGLSLELFEDESGTMTLADVQRAAFVASTRASPNFGLTKSAVWARFDVRDTRAVRTPLLLEIEYPAIDRVEVYGPTRLAVAGDTLPFAVRAIPFRQPNVELPAGDATYYVRLSGESSLQVALQLWTPSSHAVHVTRDMTFQGIYVGVMAAMILYNLFLFIAVRSRSYLYYALFIGAFLGYQAVLEGLAFQFVFPGSPWAMNHGVPFFLGTSGCLGVLFVQRLLDTKPNIPRLHRALTWFAIYCAAIAPITLLLSARAALRWTIPLAFIFSVGLLAVGIVRARQKSRSAKFFLFAWGSFLVASAMAALRAAGKVPTTPLTTYAQQVGSMLEVIILSIALADRITTLRNDAAAAQALALDEQQRAARELTRLNQELRRQIADRSRALADALAAIEAPRQSGLLSPGELFDERYRIVRAIGQGGMGAVVEVERIEDSKRFALKVMSGRATPMASARFAREAELAARMHHPNLVSIVDVGVTADGALYLLMELVNGASLIDARHNFGELGFALPVLAQVAEGLAALHEAGIVHRDLKPGNVLVTETGVVKIADFGIAREDDGRYDSSEQVAADAATLADERVSQPSGQRGLTGTGAWLGTPMYMAPELVLGVDRARTPCDLYSFGVMAWELLTGAAPFSSPAIYDVLAGRSLPEPTPLPSGLNPRVRRAIEQCLRGEPSARPTARALAELLASSTPAVAGMAS